MRSSRLAALVRLVMPALCALGSLTLSASSARAAGGNGGAGGSEVDDEDGGVPTVQPSATPDFTSCAVRAPGSSHEGGGDLSLALGAVAVATAFASRRR